MTGGGDTHFGIWYLFLLTWEHIASTNTKWVTTLPFSNTQDPFGFLFLTCAFFVSSRDLSTSLRRDKIKKGEHSSIILILLQISISIWISLVPSQFCRVPFAEKCRWEPTLEWKAGGYREWIPAMQSVGGLQGKQSGKDLFMLLPSTGH